MRHGSGAAGALERQRAGTRQHANGSAVRALRMAFTCARSDSFTQAWNHPFTHPTWMLAHTQVHTGCFYTGTRSPDSPAAGAAALVSNPPYLPAPDADILMPELHGGSDGAGLTRVRACARACMAACATASPACATMSLACAIASPARTHNA